MPILQEQGERPKTALIRRRHICKWLGIHPLQFDLCVREGLVPYKLLKKDGAKLFRTEDIERIFLQGYANDIGKPGNGIQHR